MSLDESQVAEFRASEVLKAGNVVTSGDLQPVIDELVEIIDTRARQLKDTGEIEDLYEDEPFEKRYGLLYRQTRAIGEGLDIMRYRGEAIFDFLRNDNLLDAVQSLLGEEITCNPIQHLRAKPPDEYEENTGPSFHNAPWHQDAGVMMVEAETSEVITCWLPLRDATAEMGCMEVLPGVIEGGYLTHQSAGGTTIVPELMPQTAPAIMDCRQGDVVFISRFTPHRSRPNTTKLCRWSLDLRYQPTGQHTGRTGHPDFVARSVSTPNSVLTDHSEWSRRWVDAFQNPGTGVVTHRTV